VTPISTATSCGACSAAEGRIFFTHDRRTMPRFADDRVRAGLPMPGVFVVRNQPPLGDTIDEILRVDECSSQDEWADRVEFLPL
jgi:hypothetical protein